MNKQRTGLLLIFMLIGAYALILSRVAHADTLSTIIVDSTAQEVPFITNGNCTLGEAIAAANTDSAIDGCTQGSGSDTIMLPAGTFTLTMQYSVCIPGSGGSSACGLPNISTPITIQGIAPANSIITRDTAAPFFRHLLIETGGALTLRNLSLNNGSVPTTSITNQGGAIFIDTGATLDVTNVHFNNNASGSGGGAIASNSEIAPINITGSVFNNNFSSSNQITEGGAILRGNITILNSEFIGNDATMGGAIYTCGDVSVTNGFFKSNSALYGGGGIYVFKCAANPELDVPIQNTRFEENDTGEEGGALFADGANVVVNNSLFQANLARAGGGIELQGSSLIMRDSAMLSNVANAFAQPREGSAIHMVSGGSVLLENTTIANNVGWRGTLGSADGGGVFTIVNSTITGNSSNNGTAGLFDGNNSPRTHIIKNSILAENQNTTGNGDFAFSTGNGAKILQSNGYTLIGELGLLGDYAAGTGDITGTKSAPQPSGLHDLQLFDGSYVRLPIAGGAAMDVIPANANGCGTQLLTDQRGKPRPVNYSGENRCDIGAVERQMSELYTEIVSMNEAQSYGALQVTLTDNGVYRNALGTVRVNRINTPATAADIDPLPIQVALSAPGGTDRQQQNIDYDLTICYTDWELAYGTNVTDANIGFLQPTGNSWTYVEPTSRDATNNCIRLDGLTALGTWGVGAPVVTTAVEGVMVSAETITPLPYLLTLLIPLTIWTLFHKRGVKFP